MDLSQIWNLLPPQAQPYVGLVAGLISLASAAANLMPNQNTLFVKGVHWLALNFFHKPSPVQPVPPPK